MTGLLALSGGRLERWTWAGIAVVAFSIVLLRVQPNRMGDLPRGMITPVLALELSRTPAEVERVFGSDAEQRAAWRTRMQRGTYADYGLLLAYGLFLYGVAGELSRDRSRGARVAMLLAPMASVADACENTELLTIFDNLGGHYEHALDLLPWATWAKWFLMAAYFALVNGALWRRSGFARFAALCGAAGAAATPLAFAFRGLSAEVMLNGDSIAIAALVVAAYRSTPAVKRA